MSRPAARADAPPAAEPRGDTLGDECARTSTLAAAGVAVGTAIAWAIDPAGTAAILADLFHWWIVAWPR